MIACDGHAVPRRAARSSGNHISVLGKPGDNLEVTNSRRSKRSNSTDESVQVFRSTSMRKVEYFGIMSYTPY